MWHGLSDVATVTKGGGSLQRVKKFFAVIVIIFAYYNFFLVQCRTVAVWRSAPLIG